MNATQHFTASQIARALGAKRQALARALAGCAADGSVIVAGQAAAAWSLAALPAAMQTQLETVAARRGFRNALALLASPPQMWQSALPLAEVAAAVVDRAVKLQRALAAVLPLQADPAHTSAALEAMALAGYEKEFGHRVTARAIRAIIKRTLDRDAGALNFGRLEIYLPENPARKVLPKGIISLAVETEFHALHETIAGFKYPANPSPAEKAYFWLRSFEVHDETLAAGKAPKKVRRALLEFLTRNAPWLASQEAGAVGNAIRVSFHRKYAKWLESERSAAALVDNRAESSGHFRGPDLSVEDRNKLIGHAVLACGGRVSQAWRELIERNQLSEEVLSYYLANGASKSYVPRRIRESVKHEVAMMEDIHHGPRQDKLNGAHLSRDWSAVASGDWWQADDVTFPIYYSKPDGNGWFELMRGQTLLMIDLRSTRIIGFVLISERNYNANSIRTLITKTADQYGLPRRGFYFENGTWKAKILKGDVNAGPMSWGETEMGLRQFGLEFKHARLPRAKPVEGIIGAAQNLMEGLPGYVGRNEMTEKFERVQKQKREVASRKLHPDGVFMTEEQWAEKLEELCHHYNATRQDGKMTGGLSPDEAFEKFANAADPQVKFSPACRYLLAHHRRPVNVTANGITLRFGSEAYNYRNEETGKLRGQRVFAWFNPESPEWLTVTDTNRQNAFIVARSQDVPAMDAPASVMAEEMAKINGHLKFARARYRILKASYAIKFRPMLVDRETAELGAAIGEQRAAAETAQREGSRNESKARKQANKLGLPIPVEKLRRPGTAQALERLNELLESDDTK